MDIVDLQVEQLPSVPSKGVRDDIVTLPPTAPPNSPQIRKFFLSSLFQNIDDDDRWKNTSERSASMKIQARDSITGTMQSINVNEECTMRQLMEKIELELSIPRESIVLVAQRKEDLCTTNNIQHREEMKRNKWRDALISSCSGNRNYSIEHIQQPWPWDSEDGITLPIELDEDAPKLYFYRDDTATALAQNTPLSWYEFLQHTSLCRMSFNCLDLDEIALINLTARIIQNLKIPSILKISMDELSYFLYDVCQLMHPSAYHNFNHVVDVTQCIYVTLCATRLLSYMQPIEIVAIFFAALCHDLDHPGYSNTFMNNEKSPISIRYNFESPLENHAVACFRDLCQKHNLFIHLEPSDMERFDSLVELLILRTDMSKHASLLELAQQFLDQDGDTIDDNKNIDLLLSLALKCADISNQTRLWSVAYQWNDAVYKEFWREGNADLERGRSPNPIDIRPDTMIKEDIAKKTIGFINFVVRPLYLTFKKVIDYFALTCVKNYSLSSRVIAEAIKMLDINLKFYRLQADGLHIPHDQLADRPGICGPQQIKLEYQRYERAKAYRRRSSINVPLDVDDSLLLLLGQTSMVDCKTKDKKKPHPLPIAPIVPPEDKLYCPSPHHNHDDNDMIPSLRRACGHAHHEYSQHS